MAIYGKLSVSSRNAAVERSRGLGAAAAYAGALVGYCSTNDRRM